MAERRMADAGRRAADTGYFMSLIQQLLSNLQTNSVASACNNKMFHAKLTRVMPLLFSSAF